MGASFPEKPLPPGTNPRNRRLVLAALLVVVVIVLGYLAVADNSSPGSSSSYTGTQFYQVTFRQVGACTPLVYGAPWSVTIDHQTVVEPSTATLPLSNNSVSFSASNGNYSAISFSLPDGVYAYQTSPGLLTGSGTVTVAGSDETIPVSDPVPCAQTSQATG